MPPKASSSGKAIPVAMERKLKFAGVMVRVPEGLARDGDFGFEVIDGVRYKVIVRLEFKREPLEVYG